MFDSLDFETKEGQKTEKDLTLFALTTCSFCKRAKEFLDSNGFKYRYVNMDKVDPDAKKKFKLEFTETYNKRLTYPTLLIDEKEMLTGFIRIAWEKELLQ